MATISFTVVGRPQQRGSKSAFPYHKKAGGLGVRVADDNVKSKSWMAQVRSAAAESYQGPLLTGPIRLGVQFYFKRPLSHMGSGKNAGMVKSTSPQRHTQTPDLSKLIRALEDGLTGVVWRDDRQICEYDQPGKNWTISRECAVVTITEIEA